MKNTSNRFTLKQTNTGQVLMPSGQSVRSMMIHFFLKLCSQLTVCSKPPVRTLEPVCRKSHHTSLSSFCFLLWGRLGRFSTTNRKQKSKVLDLLCECNWNNFQFFKSATKTWNLLKIVMKQKKYIDRNSFLSTLHTYFIKKIHQFVESRFVYIKTNRKNR